MVDMASAKITVYGRVQGVGFRYFATRYAARLELTGYARNLPDQKAVEIIAEGERDKLTQFIDKLRVGPTMAQVNDIEIDWSKYGGKYVDFGIRS